MEPKVVATSPPPPLDISRNWNDSNCSTPYISAPSSPQRPINLFFCSAPTSPRSSSSFFAGVDRDHVSLLSHEGPPFPSAVVPFDWEFKPGVPKSSTDTDNNDVDEDDDGDNDFEFDFSGHLDGMVRPSLSSADELFERGKIRPLKPPPAMISSDSPKSPKSPMSKFREALSPKQRKKNLNKDPFEAALQTTRKSQLEIQLAPKPRFDDQNRGRSQNPTNPRTNSRSKGMSRSLSPLRVSAFALLHQDPSQSSPSDPTLNGSSSKSGKRWRLRDFLLFRSASDGRAAITGSGKDPLKKYFLMGTKKGQGDEGSFRSTTSSTAEGSVSRRRGRLSAHELHYAANRAVSEEMKKKTPLPYKHGGLLGCLGFNPALQKAFGAFAPSS